jgi:rhamnogalacturonyl hydrolase YesR
MQSHFRRAFILCLALAGIWPAASAPAQTNDLSGQTDVSIRNVLLLVAHHNMVPLADGDYPTNVLSLAAAKAAKPPSGISWGYPWGVALYGMLQAGGATGDASLESFVVNHDLICGRYYAWLESLNTTLTNTSGLSTWQNSTAIGGLMSMSTSSMDGYGAMGAQLMESVLRHTGGIAGAGQEAAAASIANTISTRVGRLPDGTLYRPGSYGGTIWDDDLYMSCPFLVRWYEYTGDTNYLSDAARQIINMAGYDQSPNGLWWHGYYYNTYGSFSHTNSPIKWGRANGWAMVATAEVLSAMPANYPARPQVLDILRRHIEAVKLVQAPDGMWRQVLDDTTNTSDWEETSCTGMFAYSIARAVNRGWIDPTNMAVAQRAFLAICQHVKTNGVIVGTCQGTDIGTTESYYLQRAHPDDDPHGIGPVLLSGSEILLSRVAPPPPALNIRPASGLAVISWPAALTNYSLEFSTNLASWVALSNVVTLANGWQVVTDSVAASGFYRMRFHPPH